MALGARKSMVLIAAAAITGSGLAACDPGDPATRAGDLAVDEWEAVVLGEIQRRLAEVAEDGDRTLIDYRVSGSGRLGLMFCGTAQVIGADGQARRELFVVDLGQPGGLLSDTPMAPEITSRMIDLQAAACS